MLGKWNTFTENIRSMSHTWHRNRQDAIEALDIAATGKVKVHYKLGKLSDLKE